MGKRRTRSLEGQPSVTILPSQFRGLQWKFVRHLGYSLALLVLGCHDSVSLAQVQPNTLTSTNAEQYVSETHDRIVFDRDAIYSGPVPYWSRGYLISIKIESYSSSTANVTLFGRTGTKSAEVAFWFPESVRVAVTSAAVAPDGGILASGEADKADGTRAPFIALANFKGEITNVIQTGNFYPRYVCGAPDGSVWAFGSTMWNTSMDESFPGNILRRFDFRHGETAGYIPRSTFPKHMALDELSFIRCSADAVFAYSTAASVLIELQYTSETPHVYSVSTSPGLRVIGLAVTDSDAVYGALLRKQDSGTDGMYTLALDEGARSAHWHPVKGAVGHHTDAGVVFRVWGADGENVVVSRVGDPADPMALHWIRMRTSLR
jgi:hypothetical protein